MMCSLQTYWPELAGRYCGENKTARVKRAVPCQALRNQNSFLGNCMLRTRL